MVAIAAFISVLMAIAWVVQQRTGNSGWVDTIWTFWLGLVGAGCALWPIAGAAPDARQWLVAALVAIWSLRLGSHVAARSAGISDDPRYAAFAREWGVNSPRRMFIFLQNQGFGSIPLAFAIFVAARFPHSALRLQDALGALILFTAIAGEALADAQLKNFRTNPPTRVWSATSVCGAGRAIRITFSNGSAGWPIPSSDFPPTIPRLGNPVGAGLHVLDPGLRYRHPLLEAQMLRSGGERYRDYQSRTSAFFPLPPQNEANA
jgi:steroid 5-alpha reductase family enzyme